MTLPLPRASGSETYPPMVPAWTVAVSEYSLSEYVFVLDDSRDDRITPGTKVAKLIHRLTPVRVVGEDAFGHPTVSLR